MLRYGAYPAIAGGAAATIVFTAAVGWPTWPSFALIAATAIALVAVLERVHPYERSWLVDHGDLVTDVLHNLVNLLLVLATVHVVSWLRTRVPVGTLWPSQWPLAAQIALAGAIIDLGLYAMHRYSHHQPFLWRLHAIHHSSERLYWLNGERRHPLSAVVLAAPGVMAVVALGAPTVAIAAWLSIQAVHLAFQHANLDYRLGPLSGLLSVAEVHRWHHKRDYEDAQVNFGEVLLLWDRLFGSYYAGSGAPKQGDVGLRDPAFPTLYVAQLRWPFDRSRWVPAGSADP